MKRSVALAVALALLLPAGARAAVTNGQILVLTRGTCSSCGNQDDRLVTVNPDGSGLRTIYTARHSSLSGPAWSPDGNRIAFVQFDPDHAYRLYVLELATGAVRMLTDHNQGAAVGLAGRQNYDLSPTWSPDGTRIAFLKGRFHVDQYSTIVTDFEGIATIKPDGSEDAPLWDFIACGCLSQPQDIDWSPDGSRIVYTADGRAADPAARWELHAIALPGGGLTTLLAGGPVRSGVQFSPDGSRLVWSEGFLSFILRTATASAGSPSDLTTLQGGGADRDPAWSPDGRWVVHSAGPGYLNRTAADGSGSDPLFPAAGFPGTPYEPDWQPCVAGVTASCTSVADAPGGGATGTLPNCLTVQSATPANTPLDLPPAPCSDPLGRALAISVVDGPYHGKLSGPSANGHRLYTPDKGFSGLDTIRFRAAAGTALSPIATLTIVVFAARGSVRDTQAPTAHALSHLRLGRDGRVRARLRCDEACTVTLHLVATLRLSKRVVGPNRSAKAAAGKAVRLDLRFRHAVARRRLRSLRAVGTVKDEAGNRRSVTLPVAR